MSRQPQPDPSPPTRSTDARPSSAPPAPTRAERRRGALIGLAVGDALGASVEAMIPGTFPPVTDMTGGGPHHLEPGQWTDDTAMALCLAESLIECQGFDAHDQMRRYLHWMLDGHNSSTGTCFGIGRATAADSSRTTHAAPVAVDACRLLAALLIGALGGASKDELLAPFYSPLPGYWDEHPLVPEIAEIAAGSFKQKQPPEIRGSGYAAASLEAALWAFHTTESFRDGCLRAVNLGDDADTTAAVYGQIAGAFHGERAIPAEWRERLALRERVERYAEGLGAGA